MGRISFGLTFAVPGHCERRRGPLRREQVPLYTSTDAVAGYIGWTSVRKHETTRSSEAENEGVLRGLNRVQTDMGVPEKVSLFQVPVAERTAP